MGGAVLGLGALREPDDLNLWYAAGLSDRLPGERYRLASALRPHAATQFALGWLVGAYPHHALPQCRPGAPRRAARTAGDRPRLRAGGGGGQRRLRVT